MIGPSDWVQGELYRERYRPQYHFTPKQGWVGDPDGLIRYRGTYHLFWWGHATSTDLVYWQEQHWPMKGDDHSFMYYTGSVVVDEANTGGWGTPEQPAMIAIYTAHEREGGLENQRISISTNYSDFHYYEGNPVLNLNSKSFRDPDVFWHEPTQSWIMVITLPDERKIQFYASSDLTSWRYLSAFGPMAAQAPLWETPCLFQLPINGDTNVMKWVLTCSLGPNRMQFFVGDFDGRSFMVDATDQSYLTKGKGLEGQVWEDFEGRTISQWSVSGEAFGEGPGGEVAGVPTAMGYLGRGVGNSSVGGTQHSGSLKSPVFTIDRNCINFLIGGGNYPRETCLNLLVSGQVVRTATGRNSPHMTWAGWDVSEFKGQEARLSLQDSSAEKWGYVAVDHITFADVLFNIEREHANWIDWGSDFYAARMFRDYDQSGGPTIWMGWMGNWDYANRLPMSWGQGALSIPRELNLVKTNRGYELRQRPVTALQKLRGNRVDAVLTKVGTNAPLREFHPSRNTYELIATFPLEHPAQQVGLNLCVGKGRKVALMYDRTTANVTLDRRASGDVSFSEHFPRAVSAPLFDSGESVTFHVFVDQSSVEVFVNDGAVVLTSQIFPDPSDTGIELLSLGGEAGAVEVSAWVLASIWPPRVNEVR